MRLNLGLIIGGVITFIFILVLAPTILSGAATSGASTSIGSFQGTKSINDLYPLLYYVAGIGIALAAMGMGAAGVSGKGPTRKKG